VAAAPLAPDNARRGPTGDSSNPDCLAPTTWPRLPSLRLPGCAVSVWVNGAWEERAPAALTAAGWGLVEEAVGAVLLRVRGFLDVVECSDLRVATLDFTGRQVGDVVAAEASRATRRRFGGAVGRCAVVRPAAGRKERPGARSEKTQGADLLKESPAGYGR